ncbi:unnamed protein product, partial [Effrenium voratum]
QTFPFFSNSHRDFLSLLSRELDIRIFHPGQTVLREGEYGEMTYILVHGEVEVVTESMSETHPPIRMRAPSIFGESPLLIGAPARRTATVIARALGLELTSLEGEVRKRGLHSKALRSGK